MHGRQCPKCAERDVRLLDVPSQGSEFWHFSCDQCRHRWTVPKRADTIDGKVNLVSPVRPDR
jgi:hypothetical protein